MLATLVAGCVGTPVPPRMIASVFCGRAHSAQPGVGVGLRRVIEQGGEVALQRGHGGAQLGESRPVLAEEIGDD